MKPAHYCLCTVTDQRALDSIHESGSHSGTFKDRHPWHMGQELLQAARADHTILTLVFAVEPDLKLTDWATIADIDVATYSGQAYETKCSFEQLRPVNPIFEELNSLVLLPSAEQLHRESIEPIRKYRQHLDDVHVHPYAICETPPFIYADLGEKLP